MGFSLVGNLFVWAVTVGAVILIVVSIFPLSRHRIVAVVAVAAASLALTLFMLYEATALDWIVPAMPWFTDLWVWAVLFALGWSVVGWRSGGKRSRALGVVSVPAGIVMAAVLFNAYFYYVPTFGDLVGQRPVDRATASQVRTVFRQAVRSRPADLPLRQPAHGLVLPMNFESRASHFAARPGWVYLPPAWWGAERKDLPVIELLNGTPSTPSEWLRGAQVQVASDAFAHVHGGLAPVLVMVNENTSIYGDSECVDRPGSLAETFVRVDVRATMVRRFGVSADPRRWGIAGVSEGGLCALAIGLRHPNDFRAVGDFGGESRQSIGSGEKSLSELFGGDPAREAAYDPNVLLRGAPRPQLSAMFAVGAQDPLRASIIAQAGDARRDRMRVLLHVVPGGHNYRAWDAASRQFIPFAWQVLAPAQMRAQSFSGHRFVRLQQPLSRSRPLAHSRDTLARTGRVASFGFRGASRRAAQ